MLLIRESNHGWCCQRCISARSGSAHGGQAVVLRDGDVPGTHPIDQRKVHAVHTLVERHRLGALPFDKAGGVAKDKYQRA